MRATGYLQTGQTSCHDAAGRRIPCEGSGQDAEFKRGIEWPKPRFEKTGETVLDRLTGLMWTEDANPAEFPMTWQEALDFVKNMNQEQAHGFNDWRLPNRKELRSLISHQTRKPALPGDHPFKNVFLGWYWTSTTAAINPAYAWYIHMEGARMFYGAKTQYYLLWPVRDKANTGLAATGQTMCYNTNGLPAPCGGTGQDGELVLGGPWPAPRFEVLGDMVVDRLTRLGWYRRADFADGPVVWSDGLNVVRELRRRAGNSRRWRLPNINELESLVDCGRHSPALPTDHPFVGVEDTYWSSTTSMFEPDWAWALYLKKGAVGVGYKPSARFFILPVCDVENGSG